MGVIEYALYDEVEMKKPHPCGSKNHLFQIVRVGADIKIRCLACKNVIMMDRGHFNESIKHVISHHLEEIK